MKKTICSVFTLGISLIVAVFLSACSSAKFTKFDYSYSKNPWVGAFKDQVFFECLRVSYKNDTIFKLIEQKDAFNPYDGLSQAALNKAEELARNFVKNMPPATCEDCTGDDNYYMANSLHYYNSKDLDMIAREEYKNHVKEDKKAWGNIP